MAAAGGAAAQLVALLRTRPGPGAPAGMWASWFEAKAAVFDAVAAETASQGLAAEAAECAALARCRAAAYRRPGRGSKSPEGLVCTGSDGSRRVRGPAGAAGDPGPGRAPAGAARTAGARTGGRR